MDYLIVVLIIAATIAFVYNRLRVTDGDFWGAEAIKINWDGEKPY